MFRRIVSAIFLLIFLFNLGGYYLLFTALRLQANRELSAQLDQGAYDEQETIEVKIPLTLPYPIQGAGFERSRQFFTIGKEHYQVIKHKYEDDVLTIVCIKDERSKDFNDLIESMDEQQSGEDGPSSIATKVIQDFIPSEMQTILGVQGWCRDIEQHALTVSSVSGWHQAVFSPPKQA